MIPLLDGDREALTENGILAFTHIFNAYSIDDIDNPGTKIMTP